MKILIVTVFLFGLTACDEGDYESIASAKEYCADKGGIKYTGHTGHTRITYCENNDHIHRR